VTKTKVIIVVDERSGLAEKVAEVLHRRGFHACIAGTAAAALRRVSQCQHQAAVIDYDAPGGETLAVSLREHGVSVVGISSHAVTRERAVGAQFWLPKPCPAVDLVAAVERVLAPSKVSR